MTDPNTLQIEIGALAGLDTAALRLRWIELYSTPSQSRLSREVLIQAIAFRLQEQAFGSLSSATRAKLGRSQASPDVARRRIDRSVKAGTRFIREWQGRTIDVTRDGSGSYLYLGRPYRSLSAIAREVTGTRWSGPAFFGLTARQKTDGPV